MIGLKVGSQLLGHPGWQLVDDGDVVYHRRILRRAVLRGQLNAMFWIHGQELFADLAPWHFERR